MSYPVGERRIDTAGGKGYGGQRITMVPEFDLVVVSNAGDY